MKVVKKVIIIIMEILLGVLLVFNIYNFVGLKIFKKDLMTINGYALLEVISGSMEPTLKIGDLIIIDTNDKEVKENDIVTFYDVNGSFVTHRIKEIKDKMMITKGDNNNTVDEEMPLKNIVGTYKFKINGLGTLITSLKNPLVSGIIFIIGILICYLISFDKSENIDDGEYQEFLKEKNSKVKKNKKHYVKDFLEKITIKIKDIWFKITKREEKEVKKKQNKLKKKQTKDAKKKKKKQRKNRRR